LIVNESLNVDNVITYEKYKQFNTIVIRRPNLTFGGASPDILFRELKCWVNDTNILFANSSTLVSYYASWLDNSVPIDAPQPRFPASNAYNNDMTGNLDTLSPNDNNTAIIIKNIPLTSVKYIQSLVFYGRSESEPSQ